MMRLSPIRYGVKYVAPTAFLSLYGVISSGSTRLQRYTATGGVISVAAQISGTVSPPPVSLGGGYLTWNGNLYQWSGGVLTLLYAVPYSGVGVDFDGTNVRQLSVVSATTTLWNMERKTYSLAGSLLNTENFTIPKLDARNNTDIRLFKNSAQYTQQRQNANGTANVSAWFNDGAQIFRPITPPVGSDTYYSAWATSTANGNKPIFANGHFYSTGGDSRTWLAKWASTGGSPVASYDISTSTNVAAYHCADSDGNIWLSIPPQNQTLKFDQNLNLLETFTGFVDGFGSEIDVILS